MHLSSKYKPTIKVCENNYKEIAVNKNDVFASADSENKTTKQRSKKRKWREIEAIQDRFRLEKELAEFDMDFDLDSAIR